MFCTQCGAKIPDEGRFCPECGTAVIDAKATATIGSETVATASTSNPAEPDPTAAPAPAPAPVAAAEPEPTVAAEPESVPVAAAEPEPVPVVVPEPVAAAEVESEPVAAAEFEFEPVVIPEPEPEPASPSPTLTDTPAPPAPVSGTAIPYPSFTFDPAFDPTAPPAPTFDPAAPFAPPPAPPAPEQPRKSRKKLLIILGVIALVVVLAVGALVGFSLWRASLYERGIAALAEEDYGEAYDRFMELGDYKDAPELADTAWKGLEYVAALELMHAGDYEHALPALKALGDFEDAAQKAQECQYHLDYQAATAAFEQGDFERALEGFTGLASAGFSDAADWRDRSLYGIAEKKYEAGDHYGAYQMFKDLGSFEDAAERAQQCTSAYPATGVLYHNPDYVSAVSALVIDGGNASYVSYYKIYAGDTLVATLFRDSGSSCSIELPPGSYKIKEAIGDVWFGEEVLFGDEGLYEVMIFDDGNDYLVLEYNIEVTITLSVIGDLTGDSVGSSPTDRENF